jgi:uncharacterized repeat protein (TIGR03803 family)
MATSQGWIRVMITTIAVAFVLEIEVPISATAQSYRESVIHSFTANTDGRSPSSGLVTDSSGNLYGATSWGGMIPSKCVNGTFKGCGTLFKIDPNGTLTVLYSFTGSADGAHPIANLFRDKAGNMYGTTETGGDRSCSQGFGCGVVFKIGRTGKERVLYRFGDAVGGWHPSAGVIQDDAGNLYGTTELGGDLSCSLGYSEGCGVVFKLDIAGNETALHTFTGGADGAGPFAGVIRDTAGNLYGTTISGGDYGYGVVFKLDAAGNETVLHAFSGGADGAYPSGGLIQDTAGNLYGTSEFGGDLSCDSPTGCGVVFKLDNAQNLTILHSFSGLDGAFPQSKLLLDSAGKLSGVTGGGGHTGPYGCFWILAGCGVVFTLDQDGIETTLHAFGDRGATFLDAEFPARNMDLAWDTAGNLYGTTYYGGDVSCDPAFGCGTIFKLTRGND